MTDKAAKHNERPRENQPAPTADLPGLRLEAGSQIGHFRIEREIGRGGMGVVYLARDTKLDRAVAIKSLPPELMADPRVRSRLGREARLLASLSHPNIATIHDEVQEAEGAMYLILEYIPGPTLAERIATGRLALDEALSIAHQTAAALAVAHEQGIVHRDLKPGNIKITPEGNVKVLDFGLAKAIEEAETQGPQTSVTQPGRVMGTPAYMSPEQTAGAPLDHRTDIWSLGVVIYEMLTGELPFKGNSQQSLRHAIQHEEPEQLTRVRRDAPIRLEQVVSKMMQKDRERRVENMKAVIRELESVRRDSTAETASSTRSPSIAVLPFVNMSADKEQEYFCDGMAEELINALTQIRDLRVIARTSAFSYKGRDVNVRDIGRELDVATVLEGSVRKAGNRLRITAQLIDTVGGHHLWSERYDRDMDDVFAIQDQITLAIVEKLKPRLLGQTQAQVARRQTVELDVYNQYLKGLYFRAKAAEEAIPRAIECFERAIEQDPTYALAYAGLAVAHAILPLYSPLPSKDVIPRATQMALRALQLDETLSEAHAALGLIKTLYDWDWAGAERCFRRAFELNPGYTKAHHWYAYNLLYRGQADRAVEEMATALDLDPVSVGANRDLSLVCFFAGQHGRALDAGKRTVELDPSAVFAHFDLGAAYLGKSMYEEALAEFQKEKDVSKGSHAWPEVFSAYIYAQTGQPQKAQKERDKVLERSQRQYVSPFLLASLHFVLGQDEEGFKWANKAYEEHDPWLCYVGISPALDRVRSDPRYEALLKKMNLNK